MGTQSIGTAGLGAADTAGTRRPENLALVFQEVLTATVRLRSNRQAVSDAESFRAHMREALKAADQEARRRAYSGDDVELAKLAVVGFLDESILNSRNPLFADWPRKPLQEELFGTHMAGEIFFQNLHKLLSRSDASDLADILEVYYLCLLLGFGGRYSIGGRAELRSIMESVAEKIRRIRGRSRDLSPAWALPVEHGRTGSSDPWIKKLMIATAACFVIAAGLFLGFKVSLNSGASQLRSISSQVRG